jgi:hypothetical protein
MSDKEKFQILVNALDTIQETGLFDLTEYLRGQGFEEYEIREMTVFKGK